MGIRRGAGRSGSSSSRATSVARPEVREPVAPAVSRGDQAYRVLKTKLLMGELSLNSRLGEEKLAGIVGVSRTPVREALKRLEVEGLVGPHPEGGYQPVVPDVTVMRHLYEVRAGLELQALQRPARIGTAPRPGHPRAAARPVAGPRRRRPAAAGPELRAARRVVPHRPGHRRGQPRSPSTCSARSTSASAWCGCTTSSSSSASPRRSPSTSNLVELGAGRRHRQRRSGVLPAPRRLDGRRRGARPRGHRPHAHGRHRPHDTDDQPGRAPLLEAIGITKRFGEVVANDAVDLDSAPARCTPCSARTAPASSTLMKVIYGVYPPDEGDDRASTASRSRSPRRPSPAASASAWSSRTSASCRR